MHDENKESAASLPACRARRDRGKGRRFMYEDELGRWAHDLLADLDARRPGRCFVPPEGLTTPRAYALQHEVVRLREARGERVIGYKIGCTSRVIQAQLGTREPIFGRVFDTGCFPSGSRLS